MIDPFSLQTLDQRSFSKAGSPFTIQWMPAPGSGKEHDTPAIELSEKALLAQIQNVTPKRSGDGEANHPTSSFPDNCKHNDMTQFEPSPPSSKASDSNNS
jgi:hypothetical protein